MLMLAFHALAKVKPDFGRHGTNENVLEWNFGPFCDPSYFLDKPRVTPGRLCQTSLISFLPQISLVKIFQFFKGIRLFVCSNQLTVLCPDGLPEVVVIL